MTTMLVLIQFLGQAVGLCVLRYRIHRGWHPDEPRAWKVRWLPAVMIPQMTIFVFIFATTDNYCLRGGQPLLELSFLFLLSGVLLFLARQRQQRAWPFAPRLNEVTTLSRVQLTTAPSDCSPASTATRISPETASDPLSVLSDGSDEQSAAAPFDGGKRTDDGGVPETVA